MWKFIIFLRHFRVGYFIVSLLYKIRCGLAEYYRELWFFGEWRYPWSFFRNMRWKDTTCSFFFLKFWFFFTTARENIFRLFLWLEKSHVIFQKNYLFIKQRKNHFLLGNSLFLKDHTTNVITCRYYSVRKCPNFKLSISP